MELIMEMNEDLRISCKKVYIQPAESITDCDVDNYELTIEVICDGVSVDDVLDQIGRDAIKEWLDISITETIQKEMEEDLAKRWVRSKRKKDLL